MGTTERAVALVLLLGGAGVMIATASYGGRLVFDHAAGIPTEVLTSETRERSEDHQHGPGEGHGDDGHEHQPAAAPAAGDSTAPAASTTGTHVDPPGTPPHSHEPEEPAGHSDPPGTPAHDH